jgi:hypothetical protein
MSTTATPNAHYGARQVWRGIKVASMAAEDPRHGHRDLETLKQARARTTNRLKGLLRSQGVRLARVHQLPAHRDGLRLWDGSPIPSGLHRRLLRA